MPAAMHLMGKANWWMPGRLDRRLRRLHVEPKRFCEHVPSLAFASAARRLRLVVDGSQA